MQEAACAVGERVRELSERQKIERKRAVFVGHGAQLHSSPAFGIPGGHINGDFLVGTPHFQEADCGHQVRISAHDNGVVALILIRVIQQEYRDINVRSLFLGDIKKAVARKSTSRIGTADLFLLEFSENDVHERQCSESTQICFLIRSGRAIDERGEVMDLKNMVVGPEQLKEALQVQPLKGTPADCAIVEIESVYVDDGAWGHVGPKKKGNHIDCPNRHWIAGESSTHKIYN